MSRTGISWMRRARHTGVLCALLAGLVLSGCTNAPAASADEEEAFAAPREIAVEQPQEAAQPEKKDILVAIDPGHQSWEVDMSAAEPNAPGSTVMKARATTGTVGRFSGIYEYALNLDISLRLKELLEQQGYAVLLTRETNDTAISNAERAQVANAAGADIYVRIHANGSEDAGASGALALVPSAENAYVGQLSEQSASLAGHILRAYCSATGFADLGVQVNDTMTGINWSQCPVMILEMGFMTNQHDDLAMAEDSFRQIMADGIAEGIDTYFEEAS